MKDKIIKFFKDYYLTLLIVTGFGAYILIAGTARTCPACSSITDAIGISSSNADKSVE